MNFHVEGYRVCREANSSSRSELMRSIELVEVYNVNTIEHVEGVLQGRNEYVFCYGDTGAWKTHTMLGTTNNPGVMVLALKDLFLKLHQPCGDRDFVA